MGAQSSLVMPLFKEEKLWGLISCHHCSPKYISYTMRQVCSFLGQVAAIEFVTKEAAENYEYQLSLQEIQSKLFTSMTQANNFIDGLTQHQPNLLDLVNAQGAMIAWDGKITTLGETPKRVKLKLLLNWLKKNQSQDVFHTDSLPSIYRTSTSYKHQASGLLSIFIPPHNYIVWFRPEFIQMVNWAGDPKTAIQIKENEAGEFIPCPRNSFAMWKETVHLKSRPWQLCEISAASELRKSLVNIVLRQTQELANLARKLERSNSELERSNAELEKFAYIASHDLQEPLSLVSNYIQLLEMRFKSELGQDGKEFIELAVESVHHMQTLIDDLLAYSRVGSHGNPCQPIELGTLLNRVLKNLYSAIDATQASITFDKFPIIMGDETQLIQLFQNLIGNAIKFRGEELPTVHIGVKKLAKAWQFSVQDNGIGLDLAFSDRIFQVFQRLHTREEYTGTGIGLAICKKIVERHGGKIWVESTPGKGAKFFFTIPFQPR